MKETQERSFDALLRIDGVSAREPFEMSDTEADCMALGTMFICHQEQADRLRLALDKIVDSDDPLDIRRVALAAIAIHDEFLRELETPTPDED